MSTTDFRYEIVQRFFGNRPVIVQYLFEEDPNEVHGVCVTPPVAFDDDRAIRALDDGEELRIPLERVVALTDLDGPRGILFASTAPPRCTRPIAPLRERSAPVAEFVEALLLDERERAAAIAPGLSTEDRRAVLDTALSLLQEDSALVRCLFAAIPMIGDEQDALALGDLLMARNVPSWKATIALEALRSLGSVDARMQIQRASLLANDPEAISLAREYLLRVAGELKTPIWLVEDELVPSCGLDEDGQTTLDYGPRSFVLELDDALRPTLVSVPGRTRFYDLPEPAPSDDAAKAAAARERWSVIREQLLEAVPVQVQRFEESFVQQYRWSGEEWDHAVRTHPLLIHLAPRLVWGTYSKSGRKLLDTFRIARDRTLWGPDDEPYELDPSRKLGIVHRLELPDDVREAWGEQLADYEIVTLFPQIDRAVYRPDPDWGRDVADLDLDIVMPEDHGLRELARRGWSKNQGWGSSLHKAYRERDIRAVLHPHTQDGMLRLNRLQFERYLGYPQTNFQLRDVHRIVYSETIYELETLRMPQDTGGWPLAADASRRDRTDS